MGATGPAGATGATGIGLTGATGAQGPTGPGSGLNALVNTTPEPPNESTCPYGGVRIETGLDDNDNNILDDAEVDQEKFACNGAPGTPGDDGVNGEDGEDGTDGTDGQDGSSIVSRINTTPESQECPAGGVQLETGTDDDGNGILNDGEVDHSELICNGEAGDVPVFNFVPIPKNSSCGAYTGVLVQVGLDNGDTGGVPKNGVLESGEVDSERSLCVEKADLTVKGGGCSVSGPASSRLGELWTLSIAAAAMFYRRRRRASR